MKVILLQDVRKQGKKGDVIEVSPGYGRNYLIKNNLAKEADAGALNKLKSQQKANARKAEEEHQEALQVQKEINREECVVTIPVKIGEEGRVFGTITSKQIAEDLEKQHEIHVDRRKIQLDENLAAVGDYQVPIKLHPEVIAEIKVRVIEE